MAFMETRADLRDRSRWRTADSQNAGFIEDRATGSRVRCIASDPRRAHGLAPCLILADEPAQWPESTADRMYAALVTSLGKIPGSRMFALGTRPATPGHFFARLLDGGADYAQLHTAPDGAPITEPETWRAANPSLSIMPALEAAIRAEAEDAARDPSLLPQFEALRLNRGTPDTAESLLADAATWTAAEGEAERAGAHVMGVDMGGSVSWSAAAAYWPDSGRLEALAVTGDSPALDEKATRDGVDPALYRGLHRSGELVTAPGRVPPASALFGEAIDRWGVPALIVCDRWRLGEVADALAGARLAVPVETRGQGWKDGGEDVRRFRRALLRGRVTPARSGLLTHAISETRTAADPAGNEKLTKRRGVRSREDAAVAAVMAVAAGERSRAFPVVKLRSVAVA